MKKVFVTGFFYLILLSCELELNTSIPIPSTQISPIVHAYIDRGQLTGEVGSSSTDFESYEFVGISGVDIDIIDDNGVIQSFTSDANGEFGGQIDISTQSMYQLVCKYDDEIYRSDWIRPLPDTIHTSVRSMSFESEILFMNLTSSLDSGAMSLGPNTYYKGQMTDDTYFDGLGYRHFQVFQESSIEASISGISYNFDVDSVELNVVYMDDEYRKFFESLERNTSGETYTSYEPVYSNIEADRGLFCFVYKDRISYGWK